MPRNRNLLLSALVFACAALSSIPSVAVQIPVSGAADLTAIAFLEGYEGRGPTETLGSATVDLGTFVWSGVTDTDSVSIQDLRLTGGRRSVVVPLFHDLGTINARVDPAGFDPPTTVTFDYAIESRLTVNIDFVAPTEIPIDPFTLATGPVQILELSMFTELTAFVDGLPVFTERKEPSTLRGVAMSWQFADDPAPALVSTSDFVNGASIPSSLIDLSNVVRGEFNATLLDDNYRARTARENRVEVELVPVPVPEPSAGLLVGLGLCLLSGARAARLRGGPRQ